MQFKQYKINFIIRLTLTETVSTEKDMWKEDNTSSGLVNNLIWNFEFTLIYKNDESDHHYQQLLRSPKPRSWLLHVQSSSEEMLPHWALPLVEEHSLCHQNMELLHSKNPHFQMRLGAQPFLWKWVLFAWELKKVSIRKAEHQPLFWNRGPGELGNGLLEGWWEEYVRQCSDGKLWRHNWRKNYLDLVLKWGCFKDQNDPYPSPMSFRSAWGISCGY